ncbi:MAG: hypothetical protein AB7R69_04100 [Candidatus Babeliales bacterium]
MNTTFSHFNRPYSWKNLSFLFIAAFILRALFFFFYVQHEERYRQADSMDYHACAVSLGAGFGLVHPQHRKPIFWRVPGYPYYLSKFYTSYGLKDPRFEGNREAQKASIWFQIFLCSFTPILTFFLALFLTGSLALAWITGWIFVFHVGFILASTYLLTDGLATLFFLMFLILFYLCFNFIGEQRHLSANKYLYCIGAALTLSAYTWMRPNGEFIALLALIIFALAAGTWRKKVVMMILFFSVFFSSISPWYFRNYRLTEKWFFCPMSGPYHLAFTAPKILRRVTKQPLDICLKYLFYQTKQELDRQEKELKITSPHLYVPQELVCGSIARQWLTKYPHYLACDWAREVSKATFDLYSSQLVAFANNSYTYDPIEEFLTEKLKNCIYKQAMPWWMRLVCWLELIFSLCVWFGLFGGLIYYVILPLFYLIRKKQPLHAVSLLWIKTGLMIGGLLFMTGGFGYARLRMPPEALMIILSLTFWYWFLEKKHLEELTQ